MVTNTIYFFSKVYLNFNSIHEPCKPVGGARQTRPRQGRRGEAAREVEPLPLHHHQQREPLDLVRWLQRVCV